MREERNLRALHRSRRLLRVDQNRASQGLNARRVLEHDGQVAKQPDEPRVERGIHEVVEHREDANEPHFGQELVELPPIEQGARIVPSDQPGQEPPGLEDDVPRIALVEEYFAARLQRVVGVLEKRRAGASIEEAHRNDEVELTIPQGPRQGRCGEKGHLRGQVPGSRRVGHECDGGDGVLAARDLCELASERALSTRELEDRLSRHEVNHVPKRMRAPEHAVVRDRVGHLEITAPELLANGKRLD